MFKIITMCDSNYFDCGKLFLQTRDVVKDHDIICYHPNLTNKQKKILDKHNIQHLQLNQTVWDTKMQYIKFHNIIEQLDINRNKYKGYLLIDWDIFFVNDFRHIYDYDFDLCITVRPQEIKKRVLRALGCGGGFFFKPSARGLFLYAQEVILKGGDPGVNEYDRIWNTLERGRPAHKTHHRTALRWWVDQIFISSIVLRFLEEKGYNQKFGIKPVFYDFNGYKIAFVSERNYNAIKSTPKIRKESNVYIRHLQYHGRKQLVGAKKARIEEKLNG
jgi:hypothetical protein